MWISSNVLGNIQFLEFDKNGCPSIGKKVETPKLPEKKKEKKTGVLGALNRGYKSFVHSYFYSSVLVVESKLEIELEIAHEQEQLSVNAWKNFWVGLGLKSFSLKTFKIKGKGHFLSTRPKMYLSITMYWDANTMPS